MRRIGILTASLLVCLTSLMVARPALAHSHQTLAGKYDVEVGWLNEPAIVSQPNAATIRITKKGTSDPIMGVEATLTVKIAYGGNTPRQFALHTVEDQPGFYVADVIPTRVGDYIFTFDGKIEDTPVSGEKFESGPDSFDAVTAPDALQVPAASVDSTAADLKAAQADASTARTLALVGIGVGVIGIVIGIAGFVKR
ncbi:MAG TPA: hypothetical protein VMT34_03225 [Aggregatilineales bacterium]|nr:hypothetical protein [Aggregatilineales bacterium]